MAFLVVEQIILCRPEPGTLKGGGVVFHNPTVATIFGLAGSNLAHWDWF